MHRVGREKHTRNARAAKPPGTVPRESSPDDPKLYVKVARERERDRQSPCEEGGKKRGKRYRQGSSEPERVVFLTAGSRANSKPAEIRRGGDRQARPSPDQTELKNVRALSTSPAIVSGLSRFSTATLDRATTVMSVREGERPNVEISEPALDERFREPVFAEAGWRPDRG